MDKRSEELLHRIEVMERRIGEQETVLNDQTAKVQEIQETIPSDPTYAQGNYLVNSDFDTSRNFFLYHEDVTGTGGIDADVSEELMAWYTSGPDTAVEAIGAITATDNTLVITTSDFIGGDATLEIVVEGAGTAGADLVTTIASYTGPTTVELTAAAVTTVTAARVRWRLLTLVEDATDEDDDADQATNTTVKNADHTLYATTINDPDWDKENGYIRLGSTDWLCQPLRQNLIRPSVQYIIDFIYKLRLELDTKDEAIVQFFVGIWDNSPGQKKFLEGEAIDLNATVYGSPTATTSTEYYIVFTTNWGETVGTEKVTVLAPTTYSNTQYVGLSWAQPSGIIATDIYRKRGSDIYKLNPPYPASSYKDKGATRGSVLTAYPTVDRIRSQAYMRTTQFNVSRAVMDRWISATFNLPIPKDYNAAKTTDKQWFVMGFAEPVKIEETDGDIVNATTPDNSILIDRVSLDDKPGIYARSIWDSEAKRNISSTPASGDIGGFGGTIYPGGTGYCPTFERLIDVTEDGVPLQVAAIDLVDNEDKYRVVNTDGASDRYTATVSPFAQYCHELRTTTGRVLRASYNEPVAVNEACTEFILLYKLKQGDIIYAKEGMMSVESNLRLVKKFHTVKISLKGQQKAFWIDGIACHNLKATGGDDGGGPQLN